jgi:hypothetical protein
MASSSEYYSMRAQRCRKAAVRNRKRRVWSNPYLLALAERLEEAAKVGEKALAGDKPQGRGIGKAGAEGE